MSKPLARLTKGEYKVLQGKAKRIEKKAWLKYVEQSKNLSLKSLGIKLAYNYSFYMATDLQK